MKFEEVEVGDFIYIWSLSDTINWGDNRPGPSYVLEKYPILEKGKGELKIRIGLGEKYAGCNWLDKDWPVPSYKFPFRAYHESRIEKKQMKKCKYCFSH